MKKQKNEKTDKRKVVQTGAAGEVSDSEDAASRKGVCCILRIYPCGRISWWSGAWPACGGAEGGGDDAKGDGQV